MTGTVTKNCIRSNFILSYTVHSLKIKHQPLENKLLKTDFFTDVFTEQLASCPTVTSNETND